MARNINSSVVNNLWQVAKLFKRRKNGCSDLDMDTQNLILKSNQHAQYIKHYVSKSDVGWKKWFAKTDGQDNYAKHFAQPKY
jgi:hypothetical protein